MTGSDLLSRLEGALIVSCQPVKGGPLDTEEMVVAMAKAVAGAGAAALRIESVRYVHAVTEILDVPVIGLVKRERPNERVFITPTIEDVTGLAAAGAAVIAFDATDRPRAVPVPDLVAAIHDQGCVAMADGAFFEDGEKAKAAGADLLGTTLSGYVGGNRDPTEPDLALLRRWREAALGPVIAEGNIRTPAQARLALEAGAFAVVAGSAITRPEHVTRWFLDAMRAG